jgi:hypothetical protein
MAAFPSRWTAWNMHLVTSVAWNGLSRWERRDLLDKPDELFPAARQDTSVTI